MNFQSAKQDLQAGEQSLEETRKGVESGVVLEEKVLGGEAQLAKARHALGTVEDPLICP